MTLKLRVERKKSEVVQLMELTEKPKNSRKYQNKAREAMKNLPNALKAVVATNGGPTGR